ncbi:4Fe-4S dicluster domain-containing protein [Desulforamulus putei]|uniref:Fe-S-cluster-containing hydrogenase component 2 n=1 Tax=Desulforamulus putei DSM 12395 TaxID=1121429 RepID=A0A1M5BZC0_9FIRM|nr:4Fe-4S dicluster domain-containing protein [Desulforamulus putei]SHF47542.1 Fe-S-cluster-containing hydrogenase component 2 [Desulforamulus putei DSM 12395]
MLTVNEKLCTGCRICEQVCSMEHHREFNAGLSRIKIASKWPEEEKVILCRQCKAQSCIKACPQGALTFNGFVVLDNDRCDSCGKCLEACPFGFNLKDKENKPLFCDTCQGNYQCVNWCPSKAIRKGGE